MTLFIDEVSRKNLTNDFPLLAEYKELVKKAAESSAIIFIERLDQDYHSIYQHFKTENCGKVIESHWKEGLNFLQNEISKKLRKKSSFVPVLIWGGNNVGKSMFCKSLINKVLTQAEGQPKVILMDIDLGQPMFGVPSWVSLIEFEKPILSNYEINIRREERNSNDIGTLIKSYFINEIMPNRNEDYYSGTDFIISRSSQRENPFHGMIGVLFEECKELYKKDKTVVIINSGGKSEEVKNVITYELNGIDYKDKTMLGDNVTQKSVDVLESYRVAKGKRRRTRLLELNMFDLTSSNPFYRENVKFPLKLVSGEYVSKVPDVLYYGKHDLQTLTQLQTSHAYSFDSVYLSADMTEYIYSDPLILEHLKETFGGMITTLCRIRKKDILKTKISEEKEDKYDHWR